MKKQQDVRKQNDTVLTNIFFIPVYPMSWRPAPSHGVTADNNITPTYLTADGELRSADHEYGIELTHNTSTSKTTITFTKEVPSNGTIITVERANDKYLKFRSKGIF